MPDFEQWLAQQNNFTPSATDRAIAAWHRIQDKPTSITIYRGSAVIPSQTVRTEYDENQPRDAGQVGQASVITLIIFGVKDHPTQADTDIADDDQFRLVSGGPIYRVKDVIALPGEIQAKAVRVSK